MKQINNLLMTLAIIAVLITLVNLVITINKIGDIKELTGHATGDVNVTIESTASINFNTSTINWGTGAVDNSQTSATLDTDAGTVTNGNWTAIGNGLSLQNDGNTNVSFTLKSDKTAVDFIGGSSPSPTYKLKVSNNDTGACGSLANFSSFQEVTTSEQVACTNLGYDSTVDLVEIDVQLVVPANTIGTKGSVITATATTI